MRIVRKKPDPTVHTPPVPVPRGKRAKSAAAPAAGRILIDPADRTPGTLRTTSSCATNCVARARRSCATAPAPTLRALTINRVESKPSSCVISRSRLRPSNTAATTATTARPTSKDSSALRPARVDHVLRRPGCNPWRASARASCHAGMTPDSNPTPTAAPRAKTKARASNAGSNERARAGGRLATRNPKLQYARQTPTPPPRTAIARFSTSRSRTTRHRGAPSEARTASSRCRSAPRARSRFARFAHPTISTRSAAAPRSLSVWPEVRLITSRSGTRRSSNSPGLRSGPVRADSRACAASGVTPAASRATGRNTRDPAGADDASIVSTSGGVKNTVADATRNAGGSTPTTCIDAPSTVGMLASSSEGLAPYLPTHARYVSSTARWPLSVSLKSLP